MAWFQEKFAPPIGGRAKLDKGLEALGSEAMSVTADTTLKDAMLRLSHELQQGRNGVYIEMELEGRLARVLLSLVEWDGQRVPPYDE